MAAQRVEWSGVGAVTVFRRQDRVGVKVLC